MFMTKVSRAAPDGDEASVNGEERGKDFKPRRFERQDVRCPVRVRIGNRQYAAFLDNVSDGGVKLSTGSRIVPAGKVVLQLPDLPPIRGELRWSSGREAGVAFPLVEGLAPIGEWLEKRTGVGGSED